MTRDLRVVRGCSSCPFAHEDSNGFSYCALGADLGWGRVREGLPGDVPSDCPLRGRVIEVVLAEDV